MTLDDLLVIDEHDTFFNN